MKKTLSLFLLLVSFAAFAQTTGNSDAYQFSLDLTKVHKDMLTVELLVPTMNADTVSYRLPAMVPGTYKVYDFGKYLQNFKAFDKDGKELSFTHPDINTWKIGDAKKLYRISYDVEDTWDSKVKTSFVFEPAGTNIEADTNFVINNHGFFGYFEGMKRKTYKINITHPDGFYGATGLNNVTRNGNSDLYTVPNYMELVDGPIMYDRPDTSHVLVGGADILISVYSPNKLVSSKFVADSLRILLDLQRQYLGGTLPIKNYAFLIYLNGDPKGYKSGSYGALEHSYSSMYTLLEMKPELIGQTVKDVSAHEFFHIVTPLSIHSAEIGDFDYNNPVMSQHLWMYEGLTEYAAHHVQIKYGTLSLDEYLDVIRDKMISADNYNDELPFTKMSKGVLDRYEDQYSNVYAKGMLIGLCLDLKLRSLSDGKYGTQELMRDLSKKYGKDRSFNDDSLFADIVKLTYPEIGEFLNKYVSGDEPLPYDEILALAGIEYKRRATLQVLDPLGGYGLYQDNDGAIRFYPNNVNDFGREMGYRRGDVLVSLNGTKVNAANVEEEVGKFMGSAKDGMKVKVVVKRFDNGSWKTVKLKGKLHPVSTIKRHYLHVNEDPSPLQQKIRKAWINK